jgi:hypothetical protein
MKSVTWLAAVACVIAFPPLRAQETSPLQFVTEYLREFSTIEHIRLAEEREFQAARQSMLSICIASGNRYRREIADQITRMGHMSVPSPSQNLPSRLVDLYGHKLELYAQVVAACSALQAGGAPSNASYLEVMSVVSRYNAKVDSIDGSLFQTSTEAYSTLLEAPRGPHDDPRRLGITMAQKQALLREIELEFGNELQDDQQTYLVNAATVIRDAIRAHKASDER